MCGRYTIKTPVQRIAEAFSPLLPYDIDLEPRYNVAPSQAVPAVRLNKSSERELVMLRWGLIPSWAKDPSVGYKMINARSETVAEKPSFRVAYQKRRCLLPADGFYEWRREGKTKTPYYIRLADARLYAFAGLWETWHSDDETIESCTHLTTTPNELVAKLHDRMPVILDRDAWATWLDPTSKAADLAELLRPFPAEEMAADPVRPLVNSPKNEGPELIELAE